MAPSSKGRTDSSFRSPAMDLEVAESGGAWFEEASDHAVAGAPGLTLGPVTPLVGAAVVAGAFAWQRAVRSGRGGARAGSVLYYVVGAGRVSDSGPSPVREFDWSEYAASASCAQPTSGLVLARGPAAQSDALKGLVARVCQQLERIDE